MSSSQLLEYFKQLADINQFKGLISSAVSFQNQAMAYLPDVLAYFFMLAVSLMAIRVVIHLLS